MVSVTGARTPVKAMKDLTAMKLIGMARTSHTWRE
jgi:hypothetical protein